MAEIARREQERIEQLRMLNEQKNFHRLQMATNGYSYDMLHTDDSTDDESTVRKKRGKPPAWSVGM